MKSPTSGASRPYTILVDSAEQMPFTFQGIHSDVDEDNQTIDVPTRFAFLGRHPEGLGDYTIDCAVGECHVERKSIDDLIGTILGFKSGRRTRFEKELSNLAGIKASIVVVEGTWPEVLAACEQSDNKSESTNRKIVNRSLIAYAQDYRVPFLFAGGRRMAEVATFRFLDRYYFKHCKKRS